MSHARTPSFSNAFFFSIQSHHLYIKYIENKGSARVDASFVSSLDLVLIHHLNHVLCIRITFSQNSNKKETNVILMI